MGLLSSYGDFNKVTDTALMVRYSVEQDFIETWDWVRQPTGNGDLAWSGGGAPASFGAETYMKYSKPYYRVHRYATKSYSYVGMDFTAATGCQNDKLNQYTRPFSKVVEVLSSSSLSSGQFNVLSTATTYECRSDIACQHVDGGMWEVIINVNEEDEKFSYTLPQDPASMFSSENQRNYDN